MTVKHQAEACLWAIGEAALGPAQFSSRWFANPGDAPVFVVGTSDPARDWPQAQPGPLDASHGYLPATTTVIFEASEGEQARWHELRLDAIASHGPCPELLVSINGVDGLLLLEPESGRTERCLEPRTQPPLAAPVLRRVALPPGCVVAGHNELTITTTVVDEPDAHELRPQQLPFLGAMFGSALSWNEVSLHRIDGPGVPSIRLAPLPLYVEEAGTLHELFDVVVCVPGDREARRAEVTVGDGTQVVDLEGPDGAFGDVHARVAIPAIDAGVKGRVVLLGDGRPISWEGPVRPARRWTLHLIPHVHLDMGYTDMQAKVTELHSRNVERALDLLEATPDYAFSVDGSLILEHFQRTRGRRRTEQAMEAIRDGRISVNAFYALFLSGIASLEECYRAAGLAARFHREHGLPISYANLTDVPSYTTAMPSIIAALGLDTFVGIANHTRGGNVDSDTLHLELPVRWEGPDGASVLACFFDSYSQLRWMCAEPPTLVGCAQSFSRFVERYDRDDYLPDHLAIMGTHVDNEDLAHGYADLVGQWNARYAYPRLRFSTIADYASAVRPLLDRLPVLRGDGGSYWEDGVGTQAVAIAAYRRTQVLLPAAEALSALVSAVYAGLKPDTELLDVAWNRLLIGCEHTWTSTHATTRPHSDQTRDQLAWKVGHIAEGLRLATDASRSALSQLAEQVSTERPSLIVFNPAAWKRDAEVELEIEDGLQVVSPAGSPYAIDTDPPVDGLRRTRIRVPQLPGFGYRVLLLRPGSEPSGVADDEGDMTDAMVLETPHYGISFDRRSGRLRSLLHRASGRELVADDSPYALGELVYVAGGGTDAGRGLGDEATSLFDANPHLPPPQLTLTSADMRVTGSRRTPWGWVVETAGHAPSLPGVRCRWQFRDDDDAVELTVTLVKERVLSKELVYVVFPFALPEPTVRYDRQQGWVDPARDHQPGACNEWFTVSNAVTLSHVDHSIAWASADAPLFALDDVVRGRWPTQCQPRTGTILSWVMNNYWFTNTSASQEGTVQLRYAFQPFDRFDPVGATRLGLGLRIPVLAGQVTELDKGDAGPRPLGTEGVLLRTALPEAVDATVFAGRLREGVLVRLRELAGDSMTGTLWHPRPSAAATAFRCDASEQVVAPLDVSADGAIAVTLNPFEVVTVLLSTGDDGA